MQFSEQWLRSRVNPSLSTDQLSYLLTMAGLEVEEVNAAAPAFSGVVIGEVKECEKHENADRLRVTKVDVGTRYRTKIDGKPTTFRAGVQNVFNRDYWSGVASYSTLSQGAPRTLQLSATVDF